ncbi:MAG: hypothetical protein AAF690_03870 [Acidobacteriota bacterium]
MPIENQPVPPPGGVARALEQIEALSASSQHRCAPAAFARSMGLFEAARGSARLVLTRKSSNLLYNRLIAVGQRSPASASALDWALGHCLEQRAQGLAVAVTPRSRPQRLGLWLEKRGFERGFPGAKLWRDDRRLPRQTGSAEIRVRRVRGAESGHWVDVVARVWRAFGTRRAWFEARAQAEGWRHYVASIDGVDVGAGALFVGNVGDLCVGHLVDGVTLPEARRRGVQSAIIRRRIQEGRQSGCQLFCSETAPPLPRMPLVSYRNLKRQGFELAYLRDSWNLRFD